MENPTSFPTGIHDIDREILFNTPDDELFAICLASKYTQELCNESFWRNKFIREFGTDLGKYVDKPYNQLYKYLRPLNDEELLEISSEKGYLPIIVIIIEKNIVDIHKNNDEAFQNAAEYGHLDVVKYLVKGPETQDPRRPWHPADIHTNNDYSLRYAALNGNLNVVKYLIECGADIHAYNDEALRCAAYNSHLDVVKYLIKNGADIHVDNGILLDNAKRKGYGRIENYLMKKMYKNHINIS
jgi:hypothetical protein